ncbi:hypothetical protein PN434_14765 [Microcystis aeruginosa CS-558/01A06]|uniref:Uncharacterized protein n=2 Tax=Microcystis TaxID=1125 RepID=A0A841UM47_MICAE|nr:MULTISPECIES: hypothetical protein [Microcystis]AKV69092.1 hypothetical protein VL20_4148 [Microcystis panniformis FACHB-1757]MBC1191145.1 hypothetical protein [Microcystis aeruginosa BLCC-F108]MCA2590631.1 hypothetical protein [Microcystis sp. M31BS1]MDB9409761.1 hypothetical protein [Microcystis aeruginosa CS-558/01A06]
MDRGTAVVIITETSNPNYWDYVAEYWSDACANLPSYQHFVEWIPVTLIPFCLYLKHCC